MELLRLRKLVLRIASALIAVFIASPLFGQPTEYSLKSVFLYNFCRFMDWPGVAFSAPDEPFIIGIVGRDPFGPLLEEAIAGENYHGRPIRIIRYHSVRELGRCHLLFVSASESVRMGELLAATRGKNIVTVGETDSFVQEGGMIALTTVQNRVRVKMNPTALRTVNVQVSSKLLRIAEMKS